MINKKLLFLLLKAMVVLLVISCASTPPAKPTPGPQGPDQALLDELDAVMARAQKGRDGAVAVQAQDYFPDEWNKAESDNNAGKDANRGTVEGVNQGIALFTSAAEGYEAIAVSAAPLFAKDVEDANAALQAAMAKAEKSRKDAQDSNAPDYFPDDWASAEAERQNGLDAKKDTIEEMKAAAALFSSAADGYDAITGKIAKEKEDADKALQAAIANAEKSRQAAMDVNGHTYFANDWKNAETQNTAAKGAKKTTPEEIKAVTALFASVAAAYDDIAGKSQQRFAKDKDDANKALQAAIARADKSRQAATAANAQTLLPNDWRNAETKNTSAKAAKTGTLDEIKAAAALFVSAADAYDDVTRKSQQQAAKEKDDATKAMQAAMARMNKSRKDAQDAKANVNLPTDWNNAEAKNKTATDAKRSTVAEIKAATPLYTAAADAYDDLIKKNVALNTQGQKSAEDARTRATQERQKALDAKANVAVATEFNGADTVFKQAAAEFDKKSFTSAADLYKKASDQFTAAALLTEKKRTQADETVGEAKKKSTESADFAVNTGIAMEEKNEKI
jgi:hypothetical protein